MATIISIGPSNTFPPQWKQQLKLPWNEHHLVGQFESLEEAKQEIAQLKPDLVVMDAESDRGDPEVECRRLALYCESMVPRIPVVALNSRLDESQREILLRAGAAGYLLKTIDSNSFSIAVRGLAPSPVEEEEPLELSGGSDTPPDQSDVGGNGLLASRRQVLQWVGVGAAVAAVPTKALASGVAYADSNSNGDEEALAKKLQPMPQEIKGESFLLRMQRELREAIKKPLAERRWIMVIDTRKCIGCDACTIACKAENRLPPGVVYRPVIKEETGKFPDVKRKFIPRPCMQCDNPPCVPVCPVGATWKREDGITVIDYNTCIGCRYCIAACPYSARTFDYGEHYSDGTPSKQPYEEQPTPEYNKVWSADGGSPVGNARKCQFCIHRLNAGQLPACVTTCIGHATYFGDANDKKSLVSDLIAGTNVVRLKEELGTKPKVYYLV